MGAGRRDLGSQGQSTGAVAVIRPVRTGRVLAGGKNAVSDSETRRGQR